MSFDATKAVASPLILLRGEEAILVRRALDSLLETVGIGSEDFDFSSYFADASSPQEWLGAASTIPFMADRRVVVVRNIGRFEPKALTKEQFGLPPSALLILVGDEETGTDDRMRKIGSNLTAWDKLVKAAQGKSFDFRADAKAIKAAIDNELSLLNRRMQPRAKETLIEMVGGSLSRASEELQKVALFTDADPIPESAVIAVVYASREWNIWRLVDAVADGRPAGALEQLAILIGSGKKAETVALESILPQLGRQMRLLYQGRSVLDFGEETARLGFPERPNFGAEKDYLRARIFERARRMNLRTIARCLALLADADAQIKGLQSSFTPREVLEQCVLQMASLTAPTASGPTPGVSNRR